MSIASLAEGLDYRFLRREFLIVIGLCSKYLEDDNIVAKLAEEPFFEAKIYYMLAYATYCLNGDSDKYIIQEAYVYLQRAILLRQKLSGEQLKYFEIKIYGLIPILLQLKGNNRLAFVIIDEAIEKYPDSGELRLTRALLLRRRDGATEDSVNAYQEAVEVSRVEGNQYCLGAALYGHAVLFKALIRLSITDLGESLEIFQKLCATNVDVKPEIQKIKATLEQRAVEGECPLTGAPPKDEILGFL